ncbi:hypothetical protein GCM10007884_31210 [Methylobacterium brachythecii]|uniref:DUF3618 domain-containing protein n=1 Tax=Methylobacterium brachythecii TaxID=1176177 RepID=A0ABQ6D487_9HYPH|nr:hypothetical protein GCM10007884_31210 [Methylobacterium brachythecii]
MSKSGEKLEREVEASRDRLEGTLSDLQSRLNLSSLRRGILSAQASRGNLSSTFDNLARTLREDPVPVLLIGAGLAFLASDVLKVRGDRRRPRITAEVDPLETSDRHVAGNHPDRLN